MQKAKGWAGLMLVLVFVLVAVMVSGCGLDGPGDPVLRQGSAGSPQAAQQAGEPGPAGPAGPDYEAAGQLYLDRWLAGLRQAVIEACAAQPDPAGCRAAWRAAVDAVIAPTIQPPALQQRR